MPEPAFLNAQETAVGSLPPEALMYLLPSRYCESDLLASEAFGLFGHLAPGWSRVQSICDFVNRHVTFGYQFARCTRTALETFRERQGVCRDMAHLAISFCRAMNIPARYITGYLGDIGVQAVDSPWTSPAAWKSIWAAAALFRSTQQRATNRAPDDRTWPRCRGRRHQHLFRPSHPQAIPCLDGRGDRCVVAAAAF